MLGGPYYPRPIIGKSAAEVNAELDHQKAIEGGLPEDVQPFAEPRDTRKLDPEQTAGAIREAFPDLIARTGDARGDVEFLDSGAARSTVAPVDIGAYEYR